MCCCMIETSSVLPRKSSENVRKCSSGLRNNFGKSSEIFGKWSEIFGKSSKTSSLVCLYNKQNLTWPLVDTNFISSCSTRYLSRSLRSLKLNTRSARSGNILYLFYFIFFQKRCNYNKLNILSVFLYRMSFTGALCCFVLLLLDPVLSTRKLLIKMT